MRVHFHELTDFAMRHIYYEKLFSVIRMKIIKSVNNKTKYFLVGQLLILNSNINI